MAQPFSLRYPLIDGQGNFGSIDGDSPAAMRYTEARLSPIAEEILLDIEKETVDWCDNFDSLAEGAASSSPRRSRISWSTARRGSPSAWRRTCRPTTSARSSTRSTSCSGSPRRPSTRSWRSSRRRISRRAASSPPPKGSARRTRPGAARSGSAGRRRSGSATAATRSSITEIPFEVNKVALLQIIADLVKAKRIDGITDLRDESDREGTSVVIELRRDAPGEIVLNRIYEHTPLETTFGVINLCLVDGRPKVLPLKDLLELHLAHRRTTITRRTKFDLQKAEERRHILEGFLTAIDHIDEVIRIIRRSKDVPAAEASLMGKFLLSTEQAKAILDMRLARLTALEREAVVAERAEKEKLIHTLKAILASPAGARPAHRRGAHRPEGAGSATRAGPSSSRRSPSGPSRT